MTEGLPRLLFLDDEQWRHVMIDQRLGNIFKIKHVRTISQFKSALELVEKFDTISLDHDLDYDENGMMAAKLVANLPSWKQPNLVIVHSWNPPAAENMVNYLQKAGFKVIREPFKAKL